jgi:hypothetical protein
MSFCMTANSNAGEPNTIVSASKIHMLGLEAVKARLGAKWDRMSDLVHRYFEAAIRREMGPGDTFTSAGELSYLILFRDLTLSEARLKCAVVVGEVCHKLFGDQEEEISIRSLVAPMDVVDLDKLDGRTKVDATLERDGQETLFSSKSGLQKVKSETLQVEIVVPQPPLHTVNITKPSFVFRPLWDTGRSAVLTYVCQLLPETVRSEAVFSVPYSTENPEDQIVLDEICLRECLRRSADLRRAGLRVVLAVPIHFSTLCRTRNWSRYRAACEAVAPELFRDIAFVLFGFESGVPHIRLTQELPKLTRLSSQLYCLVDDAEAAGHRFRNTGAHAIGIAIQPGAPERPWIERMKIMARDVQGGSAELFVMGVAGRSGVINAIGAGARYLEGPVVRTAVVDPKNAFLQEIDDLFRDVDLPPRPVGAASIGNLGVESYARS